MNCCINIGWLRATAASTFSNILYTAELDSIMSKQLYRTVTEGEEDC
jgi:hypothetical protein